MDINDTVMVTAMVIRANMAMVTAMVTAMVMAMAMESNITILKRNLSGEGGFSKYDKIRDCPWTISYLFL